MSENTNMRPTPLELFEEGVQKLGDAGHEAALTAVGLVTLGVKDAYRLWTERAHVLEKAQSLGVEVENDTVSLVRDATELISHRAASLRAAGVCATDPRAMVHSAATMLRDRIDVKLGDCECQPCTPVAQEIKVEAAEPISRKVP